VATSSAENLDRIAQLLEGGSRRVPIQATYELDRAIEALEAPGATPVEGKLAIRVE
jgi:hypothetical protein